MTLRVVFDDPEVGDYVSAEAPCCYRPGIERCIGTRDENGVRGGFVYYSYTSASVTMSMAGKPGWMTRDLMWAAFHFPFEQMEVAKVFSFVNRANDLSVRVNLKAGMKTEGIIHDMFPEGPAYIMAMRREDCRWLSVKPRGIKAGGRL